MLTTEAGVGCSKAMYMGSVTRCRDVKRGLLSHQPKIDGHLCIQPSHPRADMARLCRNTINILAVHGSEKYLSALEPVSKRSYKRKAAVVLSAAGQLSLASYHSASSLLALCCFSVCRLISIARAFLTVVVSSQTLASGYQRGKGLCDDGDGWPLAEFWQ